MSLKNAKPGDLISASSTVYSATGADRARIVLDFLDGNGVVIESYLGSVVQATAAQRQRSVIEGITVPVGAVNTRFGVENLDDTEEATATEHMINFGPVAMAYMRPPVRSYVETMHDLTYLDGTPAEDLKPAAAGADVTATAAEVLLQNPGFEQGERGWSKSAVAQIVEDPANARSGRWVMRIDPGSSISATNDQRIPVAEGDRLLAQAYAKSTGVDVGFISVRIMWYSADNALVLQSSGSPVGTGDSSYTPTRVLAAAPAGAAYGRIRIACSNFTAGAWHVDDVAAARMPKDADIDALNTTNGPLHPNADQTGARGTKDLLADDAGLGNRADFGAIIGLPSTLAGYNITDAQKDLGPSNDVGQVLRRDLAGDTYWDDQYGSEINIGGASPSANVTLTLGAGRTPIGDVIKIPNPGKYVAVQAVGYAGGNISGDSDDAYIGLYTYCEISFDGGATWGGALAIGNAWADHSREDYIAISPAVAFRAGVPTGDIHIRFEGAVNEASGTAKSVSLTAARSALAYQIAPRSDFSLAAAALSVTVPTTRTGACAKSFGSGTTCTASATVKATVIGGVEPVTHSWSKVSGSDSITSGATSETCTVSGTHTTADPAAQYQTVIKDTVTDSRSAGEGGPQVVASNNCTVTLSYLRTFEPVSVHVPDQTFGCSVSSGQCIASGQLSRSVSGGDGNYSNAWTKRSGAGSITAGATSASCTVSNTDTNIDVEGVFRCTVTDGRSASGFDDATVTFRHRLFT